MWRRDNPESIESVKKDIKRIRRAGAQTEIFGWLLLLSTSAVIWLANSKARALGFAVVGMVVGMYFVFSGIYVKDGRGRRTKLALLVNGIVAFPLCIGLLPIYICVKSINNYSRFKDLPDQIQELYSKPKRLHLNWVQITLLIFVVLAGALSMTLKLKQLNKAAPATTSAGASAPKVDTARYGFSISFPSNASSTDFTEQVAGHSVTYTTFVSTANNGSADFDVYAYAYPAQFYNYASMPQAQLATAIHAAVVSVVQGLQGTLVNSTPSAYLGHASEDATFTSQTLAGKTTGYLRVFFIGNDEYAIFAKPASVSDFNAFANSFQYKGL